MAVIRVDEREIIELNGEGKYPSLGYFEGTIEHASLETSRNGSKTITLNLKSKNEDEWNVIVYNAIRLTNNDGSENFQVNSLLVPLLATLDIKEFDPDITSPATIKVGKAQIETTIQEYNVLKGKPIACWLKKEYRMWDNKLREAYVINDFFRVKDKATGSEIKKGTNFGDKLKELQERNETEIYQDGLTKEIVIKMQKANKPTTNATVATGWDTATTQENTDEEDLFQ